MTRKYFSGQGRVTPILPMSPEATGWRRAGRPDGPGRLQASLRGCNAEATRCNRAGDTAWAPRCSAGRTAGSAGPRRRNAQLRWAMRGQDPPLWLRIDLQEGMDFVAGEDALGDVGIACREGLGFLQRVGCDDDPAAGAVGERPRQDHPPGLVQRVHPLEVGLAGQLALGLAIRAGLPEDDKDHT